MEPTLSLYHSILFLELKPLLHRSRLQEYYRELQSHTSKTNYLLQPAWDVQFTIPHTPKVKYYKHIIRNEATSFLNTLYKLLESSTDESVKKYHVYAALNKVIAVKMNQVASEIVRLGYKMEHISPGAARRITDPELCEETFIYQFLKVQLIALYLNVAELSGGLMPEPTYNEAAVYLIFFGEETPTPSFLIRAATIEIPLKPVVPKQTTQLQLVADDFRPRHRAKANFEMIANPELFGIIEKRLFEYGIIDASYNFISNKKQANSTLLAAVYKAMIGKNYFRRNILQSKKKYTDSDIRQYLDERYATDTTQQFRKLTAEKLSMAAIRLPWLENIPHCAVIR